jgi:ribonucleoside-diphosphate reductase alpha chain
MMDDLVDMDLEAIDRIIGKIGQDPEPEEAKRTELGMWKRVRNVCESGRRTGSGLTALGDCLAALNIPYGSRRAINAVDKIYKTFKLACYQSSVDMAKELGPFSAWDWAKEKDNPFLNRIKDDVVKDGDFVIDGAEIYAEMKKYGRRNIAVLTSSPAGSMSILCLCSSGFEPLLSVESTRRRKINASDKDSRVDSVDEDGQKYMHFSVKHHGVEKWEEAGEIDFPWVLADDIDWKNRVKMQAAAQRHIDHGISSTINLPKTATVADVDEIYRAAWKAGCKGITVYREGARRDIIVRGEMKDELPTRPRILPCDVHHVSVKGLRYFVLVGLLNGKPYEVFAGKNGVFQGAVDGGQIIRKRKNFYKFVDDKDINELSPITASMDDMEECVSRLCSGLLRTGADMNFVVGQLEKIGGDDLHNFGRCISRVLKKYIKDGEKVSEKCPDCGGALVRQAGCPYCNDCGWSRCV